MECAKQLQVRLLSQHSHEYRLTDEELERFEKQPDSNSGPQRDFPVPKPVQSNVTPAEFTHPQRQPRESQQKRSLAQGYEFPFVSQKNQRHDD